MSVRFKFKSAKGFDTIPLDGTSISLGVLKRRIVEKKRLNRGLDFNLARGLDFNLVITDAQTGEGYFVSDFVSYHDTVSYRVH